MKLRYLRVRDNPPLSDVAITFHHESALGRQCAVNFIVGVNGSGKSRMLQVIAQTIMALSRHRVPPYPITLAYDLGAGSNHRTLCLYSPGAAGGGLTQTVLIEYQSVLPEDTDWENILASPHPLERTRFSGLQLPTIEAYLPSVLLAHTSGAMATWEEIFSPRGQVDEDAIREALEHEADTEERPVNWDAHQENEYQKLSNTPDASKLDEPARTGYNATQSVGILVAAADLKLAVLAVTLAQAATEFRERIPTIGAEQQFLESIQQTLADGNRMTGLRGILNEVDWLWPVTINLRLAWRPERLTGLLRDRLRAEAAKQLFDLATVVIREPEGVQARRLVFELRSPASERPQLSTAAALLEIIGGENPSAFSVFKRLREWRREGWLEDVTLLLRKRGIEDLLLYDWLSDGEQVFLGRMALFFLLKGHEDTLLLLDEPETHFNDVWKREMVDIIDDSLGEHASNVVITTHSSIALTDVFSTEITVLKKQRSSGQVMVEPDVMNSFGASPNEVMRGIFGAADSVGQRATEFLDLLLTVAAHPAQVESVWQMAGSDDEVRASHEFQQLWQFVLAIPRHSVEPQRLLVALRSVRKYAQQELRQDAISVADVLTALHDKLGPGYYQFEFRRRLRALQGVSPNASPNQAN